MSMLMDPRWACRMEIVLTEKPAEDSYDQRRLTTWRCAHGCGRELLSRNEHIFHEGSHYCYAILPEPQLIYVQHTKGQPGCVSDWYLFRIEWCTCMPGMLGRSRERQIITLTDRWRYESSHRTAGPHGGGYPSPY